jgi:hypothetical protein
MILSVALVAALAVRVSFGLEIPLFDRAVAYYNPLTGGGSMLDDAGEYRIAQYHFCLSKLSGMIGSGPVGEPLNIIISGLSSPHVLTDDGFLNFARSIGLQVMYRSVLGIC